MDYQQIVNLVFSCIGTLLSAISLHFVFFFVAGLFTYKKFPEAKSRHNYGIIIAARNEEKVVANLIDSIRRNDYPQDKLHIFVVAHNCTDNTAEAARQAGATVYEYDNNEERTKGYAFRYLFECIRRDYGIDSFEGYFSFDADNILSGNYISKMNDAFEANGCQNVITSFRNSKNFGSNVMSGIYGVFWMWGCRFESRGRTVMGCSTRVQGTGYLISSAMVAQGWPYVTLTEDWEFSADRILCGDKIVYCDEAEFYDEQPTTMRVMFRQRIRWAKGCLLVFVAKTRQLFCSLFSRKNKHKMSSYDIWANTFPVALISLCLTVLQYCLLAFSPLFGLDVGEIALGTLKGVADSFAIGFLGNMLGAVLVFIVERKRIHGVGFWRKVAVVLMWPIFQTVNIFIIVIALFSRNLGWKTIPHNDVTNITVIEELVSSKTCGGGRSSRKRQKRKILSSEQTSEDLCRCADEDGCQSAFQSEVAAAEAASSDSAVHSDASGSSADTSADLRNL